MITPKHQAAVTAAALLALAFAAPSAPAATFQAKYEVFRSAADRADEQKITNWCGQASGTPCFSIGVGQTSVLYDQAGLQARAVAAPGVLRVRAEAAWPELTFTPYFSTATATITDTIRLSGPPGEAWTLARLQFGINGSLEFTTNGTAAMSTIVRLAGDGVFSSNRFDARRNSDGLEIEVFSWGFLGPEESVLGNPFGLFELTVRLPLDRRPIEFRWDLDAQANPTPGNFDGLPGSAAARLDGTANWIGIEFLDGNLQPLEGVQLFSEGGYDWSTATVIPLPAAGWLLLSALAGLFGFHLRTARRSG